MSNSCGGRHDGKGVGNEFCVIEPGNAFLAGCGFLGEVACDGSREVGLFWSDVLGWPPVWDQDQETAIQSPHDAGVGDDAFFLVGDAIQFASIPCLFAMGNTIAGERHSQTLSLLLVSPAKRIPLFLGRALPVIVNGLVCSLVALGWARSSSASASLSARCRGSPSSWPCPRSRALAWGLAAAALALRVRETAVLSNLVMGILLIICGVNVVLSALPGLMATVGRALPLTHGIEAARALVGGAGWSRIASLVVDEAGIGLE